MGVTPRDAALLTVSDTVAAGGATDASGDVVEALLTGSGWTVRRREVVADDSGAIAAAVRRYCDEGLQLVVTTGGTGVGPRDVTPEALRPLLEKELPGVGELMRRDALAANPRAALSRAGGGTRGRTFVVFLPGSPRGAEESLRPVLPLAAHVVDVLAGAKHAPHGRAR